MRSRLSRVFAARFAFIVPLLPIAATADSDNYGQYFCVAEHVVGFVNTYREGGQTLHSGKIDVPDEETKFFIKITPKQYNDAQRELCAADMDYWSKKIEQGIPVSRPRIGVHDPQWIGINCFASDEITLESVGGKIFLNFYGYGREVGYQYWGFVPSTWFQLYEDAGHTFEMGLGHIFQGPVVEHGHCTKIEPPK
jgi:hypothetical protein